MKRKILALLFATTMVCGLFSGCAKTSTGGNSEQDGAIVEEGDSTTEKETESETEEEVILDPNKEYVVTRHVRKDLGVLKSDMRYTYDENGRLETETYYSDGKMRWTHTFEYNEHDDIVRQISDTSAGRLFSYKYDANGNIIWKQEEQANADNIIRTETWKYDSNNNLIEHYEEDNANWSGKECYKYDANGNMIEFVYYEQGDYYSTTIYEYQNNVLTSHVENNVGGYSEKHTYNYNENGQLVSVVIYSNSYGKNNPDGYEGKIEYEYHENGVLAKESEYVYIYNDTLSTVTEYDEAGNKIYWKNGSDEQIWEYIEKPGQ